MDEIRILGICGSLRKGSFNRRLLQVARAELPERARLELADLAGIPIYDGDVESAGLPASVQTHKQQIRAADALLIATPEYNYSVPGALKNALDWCSRPTQDNPFRDKPLAIMGASQGLLGTARAQYHLRQIAVSLDLLAQPARGDGRSGREQVRRRGPADRYEGARTCAQVDGGAGGVDAAPAHSGATALAIRVLQRISRFAPE